MLGGGALLTAVEEHGAGRQLVRVPRLAALRRRPWPRSSSARWRAVRRVLDGAVAAARCWAVGVLLALALQRPCRLQRARGRVSTSGLDSYVDNGLGANAPRARARA